MAKRRICNRIMLLRNLLAAVTGLLLFTGCSEPKTNPTDSFSVSRLRKGNEEFINTESKDRIIELQKGQLPYAVIVSCSDSRVSPEIIFHETLGSLFVVRTAGNIIGDYEMGSIEYAIENFHSSLIVVLGHENCGAVGAYLKYKGNHQPGKIQEIVNYLEAEIEVLELPDSLTMEVLYPLTIRANVLHGLHELSTSEIIRKSIADNKLEIIGAIYSLKDGHVEFFTDADTNTPH